MYLYQALALGIDYSTAMDMPMGLLQDVIASGQILDGGYKRIMRGDDAEDEFRAIFALK